MAKGRNEVSAIVIAKKLRDRAPELRCTDLFLSINPLNSVKKKIFFLDR